MSTPGSVISLGYGVWGTVGLVVTLGFGSAVQNTNVQPGAGSIPITGYAPSVTQSGQQNSGGFIPWEKTPQAKRFKEQIALRKEAEDLLERSKTESIALEAAPVLKLLEADIERIERQAKEYEARLDKQASLTVLSAWRSRADPANRPWQRGH